MNSIERIDEFLRLQDKGISLEEIASTLGVKPQTLKRSLNKNGYKNVKGKYLKKDICESNASVQVAFEDTNLIEQKNSNNTKTTRADTKKKKTVVKSKKENQKEKNTLEKSLKTNANSKTKNKSKKDKKINLTQEDLDKLCEVYDWYLEVKDFKSLKRKTRKKDINIDFNETEDKTISIKVDKGVWEDFLRLCSNSNYDRKTLVTQALNDFMKAHKDLL
ncbi:MAG: DNA-binding protein [Intestinibacter bartlettii]|uniref:DNA-binding protein n=1 Tax=Intestinibacter bartlettii TaxID=261299 RepID=UPI0026EE61E0|nr:DNA-binding protein [Intestinibacter bartlettii]MDO5011063.1 DNA-binding protein [Intestinibacter bartlettii]